MSSVTTVTAGKQKRTAVIFPKEQRILQQLGENIRLAMKRRKITQAMIADRTGLSKPTLRNIERGESTVSIGHYLRVLAVLGLADDLAKVASDDEMGRKVQDIELLSRAKSVTKRTPSPVPTPTDKRHRMTPKHDGKKSTAIQPKEARSSTLKSLIGSAMKKAKEQRRESVKSTLPNRESDGDDT
ncbi:helix-turn-helix domain-containing protein [Marinobacterium aestuarii]|uniref:helix-turn-helix domain-containing protein n=1 Tax=Marinobacterium aestuarii TaxID=1821621 RepID=UPI000A06D563|nr:helix-turn-helix transcriptional regulator [Marinobacterium aestuarii]